MIRNKLKSRRGASLSMSLLVFLVCALASSVVLVAATASAGRLSNLAKMDQRYYAVNSAADLIRTVIEQNPTVTVVDTSVITTTTTIEEGTTSPTVHTSHVSDPKPSQLYVAVVPTGGASGGAGGADPGAGGASGGAGGADPGAGGASGGAGAAEPTRNVTDDELYSSLLTVVAKSLAAVEETEAEKAAKDTTGSGTTGEGTTGEGTTGEGTTGEGTTGEDTTGEDTTGEGTTGEGTTGEDSPESTELIPGKLVPLGTFKFVPQSTGEGGGGGASAELTPQQRALQVEIRQMFQTNGTLIYYISKKVETEATAAPPAETGTDETSGESTTTPTNSGQEYTLKMIFEADIRRNTVRHTDYGVPQLVSNSTKQTVDKETITTTTTYTWRLTDVVKSRVPTSPTTVEGSGGDGSEGEGSGGGG